MTRAEVIDTIAALRRDAHLYRRAGLHAAANQVEARIKGLEARLREMRKVHNPKLGYRTLAATGRAYAIGQGRT
jgi:cell fate (sporulation/competence/biofilm development) regulator YmcA (YheA/YmcA/DUF963 family)